MKLKSAFLWFYQLVYRFVNEGYSYRAASLVYATLLAIVPMATVGLTVLSWIPYFQGLGKPIQNFILNNFVTESATNITVYMQQIWQQTQHIPFINLVFLLFIGVFLLLNIKDAFNSIWETENQRNYFVNFSINLVVLITLPILLGLSLLASTFLFSLPLIKTITSTLYLHHALFSLFPYLFTFLAFFLLNWLLPSTHVPKFAALLGAFTSTVLFELSKWGFAEYVKYSTTYKLLYGTLSVIPIFLIWVYVCWVIVLFGAVVAHDIAKMRHR